ncbi:MAG TPA: response regulator transcription factor, partial [Acetobacteraceae bacterium]|nr:response regulator transcription factor [Acetobacteraceae bacterium]
MEDEPELGRLVRDALERAGFAADLAVDLADAEEHLRSAAYDALVLDLGLPDGDGIFLVGRLRRGGGALPEGLPVGLPVLVLTARDGPEERVAGLDAGADDYLVKPFHMPELVSRIRALLRRPSTLAGPVLEAGNLAFDPVGRSAMVAGRKLKVTAREAALLEVLLRRPGRVVTRGALEEGLYSFRTMLGSNAVEVLVHRLRRKLAEAGAT